MYYMSDQTKNNRQFTCGFLTDDGAIGTRGRAHTVNYSAKGRMVEDAALSPHGLDAFMHWLTKNLAEGRTVILHPGDAYRG